MVLLREQRPWFPQEHPPHRAAPHVLGLVHQVQGQHATCRYRFYLPVVFSLAWARRRPRGMTVSGSGVQMAMKGAGSTGMTWSMQRVRERRCLLDSPKRYAP